MTKLLAQHGAAKGKKIDSAIDAHYLSGVIFSPREESYDSIHNYTANNTRLRSDSIFLDPQLYYSTYESSIYKHLEDDICFPQKISRRDWRKKTPDLMSYLEKHAENSKAISDSLITPGFYIQNLDWRFDYTMEIYEYCQENYDFDRYYLSLLISNNFFHSKSDVDEMLEDIIETIESKDGVYFSICYDKTDEKDYEYVDPQNLANILYFVQSLKTAGFEIMVGYTFINSILFAMLDCEYVATGWFNNIRKFCSDRFEEINSMGRRKKRYTSIPLFSYITIENLQIIDEELGNMTELLSGCSIDIDMVEDPETISFVDLEQQYWQALSMFIAKTNTYPTIVDKTNFVLSEINKAKALYGHILESISKEKELYGRIKSNAKHLDSWIMAIETFKNRISLL